MEIARYIVGSMLVGAYLYFAYRAYQKEDGPGGGWFLVVGVILAFFTFAK